MNKKKKNHHFPQTHTHAVLLLLILIAHLDIMTEAHSPQEKRLSTNMSIFVHRLSCSYLSDNSVDVSQESNSRFHVVPHLLSIKVNLHADNS